MKILSQWSSLKDLQKQYLLIEKIEDVWTEILQK